MNIFAYSGEKKKKKVCESVNSFLPLYIYEV